MASTEDVVVGVVVVVVLVGGLAPGGQVAELEVQVGMIYSPPPPGKGNQVHNPHGRRDVEPVVQLLSVRVAVT